MSARIRADLESMPGYVPGRNVPGAVKLASNEVSAGPLPSVVTAIAEAAADVNRYPDNGVTALLDRLADRLGVPQAQVSMGAGSVML
ncbi:MAG: aminotransferase, partial [Stackebrandtia sp.]